MSILPAQYAIHRFDPHTQIPLDIMKEESFYHISKTSDELSIVCRAEIKLLSDKVNRPYSCLKVLGPLDFSLVGIISNIAIILKQEEIPIFVISTFDTDYILIETDYTQKAIKALNDNKYISITNAPNSH